MRINNVSEFFQFIRSTGLSNLSPETSGLVMCMEDYGRMCPCDPAPQRAAKLNNCKAIYVAFLRKASAFRDPLLSKVSDNNIVFCSDNQYVATISR